MCTQLDASHVAQPHGRTIGIGAQYDIAKLLHIAELAVYHHSSGDTLASDVGQLTNGARRYLRVLGLNRTVDVGR